VDEFIRFLGVMSALSASATTMTTQLKKRYRWLQFDDPQGKTLLEEDGKLLKWKQGKFHANIHLVCGLNGFILAALANIHPLSYLDLQPFWTALPQQWLINLIDYLTAGVMVAYGGPWFHEVLGILREHKQSLRGTR
jgi:hypothetical protein